MLVLDMFETDSMIGNTLWQSDLISVPAPDYGLDTGLRITSGLQKATDYWITDWSMPPNKLQPGSL